MHHRQPGHQRDTDLDERHPRAPGDSEHQRDEQNEPHLEEDRDSNDEGDEHDRPMHAPFSEEVDQRYGDARGSARLRHHLAQHRPEADDDCDEAMYVADAVLKRLDRSEWSHAGHDAHRQRNRNECDEGMKLEAGDEHNERAHRKQCVEKKAGGSSHADPRATRAVIRSCGDCPMSHTHASSSGSGSSSVVNWLSNRDGGMKCPFRAARRWATSSRRPLRNTKRSSGASARRMSRYDRLSAEQDITSPAPASLASRIRAASERSHRARSSSVSGIPRDMRSMFSAE